MWAGDDKQIISYEWPKEKLLEKVFLILYFIFWINEEKVSKQIINGKY